MTLQQTSRLAVLVVGVIVTGATIAFGMGAIGAWEYVGFALTGVMTALNASAAYRATGHHHG